MAYEFSREKIASFKFQGNTSVQALNLSRINGTNNDAATVVTGIQGLLYIGDLTSSFDPTDGVRTVKDDVINNGN